MAVSTITGFPIVLAANLDDTAVLLVDDKLVHTRKTTMAQVRTQINSNHQLAGTDATWDIGASGASRFRDLFLSRNIVAGGPISQIGTTTAFFVLDTTSGATSDNNALFFKRGGVLKWRIGNNIAGTNVDRFSIYNDALGNEVMAFVNATGAGFVTVSLAVGAATNPALLGGAGTYGMLTFNGTLSTTTGMGIFGRVNGTEGVYLNTPSGTLHRFTINGVGIVYVDSTGLLAGADATYDIGASGASRFRDMYLSRNLVIGDTLTASGRVVAAGLHSATNLLVGVPHNTATTILALGTIVSNGDSYLVTWGSETNNSGGSAVVVAGGANYVITQSGVFSCAVALSGSNLQVTQLSGVTQTYDVKAIRIN